MKTIMSRVKILLNILSVAAVLASATGCSTTKQTENLLSAAGFKMVPAATPEQKAHLQRLPAGKVTTVQRNGTTYFVYPDAAKEMVYVGQQPQYQEYQKLRLQNHGPASSCGTEFRSRLESVGRLGWRLWISGAGDPPIARKVTRGVGVPE